MEGRERERERRTWQRERRVSGWWRYSWRVSPNMWIGDYVDGLLDVNH
jgi:hypothetical protein